MPVWRLSIASKSVHKKQWDHSLFLTNERDQYLLALNTVAWNIYTKIVSTDWIELLKFVTLHRLFETCAMPNSHGTWTVIAGQREKSKLLWVALTVPLEWCSHLGPFFQTGCVCMYINIYIHIYVYIYEILSHPERGWTRNWKMHNYYIPASALWCVCRRNENQEFVVQNGGLLLTSSVTFNVVTKCGPHNLLACNELQ